MSSIVTLHAIQQFTTSNQVQSSLASLTVRQPILALLSETHLCYDEYDTDTATIFDIINNALEDVASGVESSKGRTTAGDLSYRWVTRAIACSSDDFAPQVARAFDTACIAASNTALDLGDYWRIIR